MFSEYSFKIASCSCSVMGFSLILRGYKLQCHNSLHVFSLQAKTPLGLLGEVNKLRFRMRQDGIKPSPLGEPVTKLVMPAGRYNSCLPSQHRPSHLFPTIITVQPIHYVSRMSWEFTATVLFAACFMSVIGMSEILS